MADTAKKATTKKADAKSPRERFVTIGGNRVSKAIKALRNLKNVSVRKSYEYTAADIDKMFGALRSEMSALESTFKSALEGKSGGKADSNFTFG